MKFLLCPYNSQREDNDQIMAFSELRVQRNGLPTSDRLRYHTDRIIPHHNGWIDKGGRE